MDGTKTPAGRNRRGGPETRDGATEEPARFAPGGPGSPEEMFADVIRAGRAGFNGTVTPPQVGSLCRGYQTGIAIAKNADLLGDIFDRVGMATKEAAADRATQEQEAKRLKIAALRAELEALEA